DGNVVQQNVSVQIEPGETVADTVYVDLSDLEIGQEVSISMCDSSQSAANENTIETEYAKTDIALVGTATQDAAGIQVKVVAKNQGENDADIDVSLYSDSNMQNLLSEEKSVKVTGEKQEEVSFTVDPKDISYNENRAAYLTVQANVTGGDYDISNNVVYLALYEGEEVNANTAPKETADNPEQNPSKDDNPQKENPAGNSGNPLNSQKPQTQQPNGINSQTTGKQMTALKLSGISKKIAAGKKIKLTPSFTPADAANQTIIWTSSNPKYATVSQKGVVTTKKKGAGKSVTITAASQDGSGITASYKIKIVKDAVKSIKLKAVSKSVKAGKKVTLKATVKTSGKTANKTLQWSSSNNKYATVSKKGVVTTKKAGKGKTVKITAMATDGTGKKAAITFKIQ
ncbi:MAG: Ig-like domain-containing protein, partial [Lachnospiraceae bacterium]|nr:Ig-like domain-containing protein [Lachnospiraceae bacterium]